MGQLLCTKPGGKGEALGWPAQVIMANNAWWEGGWQTANFQAMHNIQTQKIQQTATRKNMP
jgi:hypothetical protein